ncbi:transcriptional regulator with XRE-family HTH domain [Paraburkholderia sp. HC6.4b]|uniref:helix-turn-helix domain-containing protein n=1 Tax=unclassified Paraburkholderia TaxID=2615204 RepID=UPI00161F101B|nr:MULTISPECIES: helix-turn-helix transcriptional regulator [unclassified Paraburkholderia]MBB5411973.1 transcriptional regulator with XRE-family HTH domain [Paraburkholderia sp. HC6.4b]MBB5454040.1 transcriptional regulator with XRE-family HTH domain [Paraburkholderia sp. Kb1A]
MNELVAQPDEAPGPQELNWYHAAETDWTDELKLDFALSVDRELRRCSLTRSDLARSIGTSPAWVTKVLRGDANPTIETMQKIASAVESNVHVHLAPKGCVGVWVEVKERADSAPISAAGYVLKKPNAFGAVVPSTPSISSAPSTYLALDITQSSPALLKIVKPE